MAGTGTGVPLWFRCSACRRTTAIRGIEKKIWDRFASPGAYPSRFSVGRGFVGDVRLTGATRPNRSTSSRGRASHTFREYVCRACGHTGWSNHVDLERLEK